MFKLHNNYFGTFFVIITKTFAKIVLHLLFFLQRDKIVLKNFNLERFFENVLFNISIERLLIKQQCMYISKQNIKKRLLSLITTLCFFIQNIFNIKSNLFKSIIKHKISFT